jgi:Holliday junction resolvase RusA-like endonuclease
MGSDTLHFDVPIIPVGKQRPRVVKRGRFVSSYTPDQTVAAEDAIRFSFRQAFPSHEAFPEGVVLLTLDAYFPPPKSFPRWKQERVESERFPHTKKPDIDNIVKLAMDALNGIAYQDDSQVWIQSARKVYSNRPRLAITLTFIDLPAKGDA